jgi:hypothetical protein
VCLAAALLRACVDDLLAYRLRAQLYFGVSVRRGETSRDFKSAQAVRANYGLRKRRSFLLLRENALFFAQLLKLCNFK